MARVVIVGRVRARVIVVASVRVCVCVASFRDSLHMAEPNRSLQPIAADLLRHLW